MAKDRRYYLAVDIAQYIVEGIAKERLLKNLKLQKELLIGM